MLRSVRVRRFEAGLLFHDGEFRRALGAGRHWLFDPFGRKRVEVVSRRDPFLRHEALDEIVKSGKLGDEIRTLDLKDHERAVVWVDGRCHAVLGAGLHAYWNTHKQVRVELFDARRSRFEHPDLKVIAQVAGAAAQLETSNVQRDHAGALFLDGAYVETLAPGMHAFWRRDAEARVVEVDLRETTLDVGGQDVMTADKVTLRLNVTVNCRVVDPRRAVSRVADARQALYRDVQLALRAAVGARELDAILSDKDALAGELAEAGRRRAADLGLELTSIGVRDVILPGDMKELLNKVTEAKKAAEANLIVRREETAAIRSQANTAKLLAESPMLLRLRELEVLEKIAAHGKLNVVMGDKGLADKVLNLL